MTYLPILSLPASEMNVVLTPALPRDIIALKAEPPGTASMGLPSLNMMSRTVSPIPITFRMSVVIYVIAKLVQTDENTKELILFFILAQLSEEG